jgi:ribosomal protein L11 methyltransferase
LPRHWLKRFARRDPDPIKIGKRFVITRRIDLPAPKVFRCEERPLVNPASTAFGTGEYATTVMSLRLLEELTRHWNRNWSLVDLGTGSGIFAIAAKRFGARRVIGIDNDPMAISIAKSNARLNKVRGAISDWATSANGKRHTRSTLLRQIYTATC